MVDPDRLRRLIAGLERWRDILADEPADIYRRRYAVQSAAQATIDIANHVIAANGWRVPQDYGDAFTVLAEHDVIDNDLAANLRALAGLRNLLVHLYDEIDDDRVAQEAAAGLDDLGRFAQLTAALAADEAD